MNQNGIKFIEDEIFKIDLKNIDELKMLIVHKLCGKDFYQEILTSRDSNLLNEYLNIAFEDGLNYDQFNELLLLLNQHKIGAGFFEYFFNSSVLYAEDIKNGIIKFRGFAMLCFGNIRFAYKTLKGKKIMR